MKRNHAIYVVLLVVIAGLVGCLSPGDSSQTESPVVAAATDAPAEVAVQPTPLPAVDPPPTDPPPTPSPEPLPETPTPIALPPMIIDDEETAADGCIPVLLNTDTWAPIHAAYSTGSDPFFQLHDNEDGFYFNAEFYTVYGAGYTGGTGTFATDCNANGICVYLVPDDMNAYLATAGEVEIVSLEEEGGSLTGPVDVTFSNLTLMPVPGTSAEGCYHIDEVHLTSGD